MKAEKAANIALENDELTDLLERNKYEKNTQEHLWDLRNTKCIP
jgi:hypothetical protein